MMGLLQALDGSSKNASSCFINMCICGDVHKGMDKIFIQMLLCNGSGVREQTTLLGSPADLALLQAAWSCQPCPLSLLLGSAESPRLHPYACRKAKHSPLPRQKAHGDRVAVLDRLCLLTAAGIKVKPHFYKVISNLFFNVGGGEAAVARAETESLAWAKQRGRMQFNLCISQLLVNLLIYCWYLISVALLHNKGIS